MRARLHERRPAALVVSIIAVVIAVGGTAFAAGSINGGSIKNHSISGKKLKNHTLTGKQINLARLGTVPSAAKATTAGFATTAGSATTAGNAAALNGVTVHKLLFTTSAATAGPVTLFNADGLTLQARCTSNTVSVDATSSVAGADIEAQTNNAVGYVNARDPFGPNTVPLDLTDGKDQGETTFSYVAPSSGTPVVSGEFGFNDEKANATNCVVDGFATAG